MLTGVSPPAVPATEADCGGRAARPAWWVRAVAHLPLSFLYGIAALLGWLSGLVIIACFVLMILHYRDPL